MAEIHVNMKQMNKFKVYSDNVIAYDQIIQSKGKFFTDRPEIYTRWLDEYGIFYTLKGAEKEIRKANPAPRKRATKKSTPKSFDQFTKRQLQDFITGCHNARDYGPEFTAACYALNSRPVAHRKTNPATRKRAISRPSQVTKKAPTKRLVARRKVAAKNPVKGYFPNPRKKRDSYAEFAPVEIQINTGAGWILYAAACDGESAKKLAKDLATLPKFKNVAIRVMG
jgi:hypothetical protein